VPYFQSIYHPYQHSHEPRESGFGPGDIYYYAPSEEPTFAAFDNYDPEPIDLEIDNFVNDIYVACEIPPELGEDGLPRADGLRCTFCGLRGHLIASCEAHPVRVNYWNQVKQSLVSALQSIKAQVDQREIHLACIKKQQAQGETLSFYRPPTPFPVCTDRPVAARANPPLPSVQQPAEPSLPKRTVKKPQRFNPYAGKCVKTAISVD
jgi:hypothetical protein